MCTDGRNDFGRENLRKVPLSESIGLALAHDITEIRPGELKCRAYRRGHVICEGDIDHLLKLGKEQVFVLTLGRDEVHEDDAARLLAAALMGEGVTEAGEPKEGKINIVAARDGLLKINKEALLQFNMLGDIMCATLHNDTPVKRGLLVGGTRAVPLIVKKEIIEQAMAISEHFGAAIEVRRMRRPRVGVVITGNEVYFGRIPDAFAPVITKKIAEYGGEIADICYAPDDEEIITDKLCGLLNAGADLLVTTGGMSVDPDDVTRFAISNLGARDLTYGSAVLPGAMFLIAYLELSGIDREPVPILGIPACGIYHKTTVFDLVLPRILAGERVGRRELAELGHGGLCMNCKECRYPACPFGKY